MKYTLFIALCIATLMQPAYSKDTRGAQAGPPAAVQSIAMTEGEVRKVDVSAKKVTLKHGAIPNIDMPPMTMVFHVSDPAMLDRLKKGDKVMFTAEDIGGTLTVTRIEPRR